MLCCVPHDPALLSNAASTIPSLHPRRPSIGTVARARVGAKTGVGSYGSNLSATAKLPHLARAVVARVREIRESHFGVYYPALSAPRQRAKSSIFDSGTAHGPSLRRHLLTHHVGIELRAGHDALRGNRADLPLGRCVEEDGFRAGKAPPRPFVHPSAPGSAAWSRARRRRRPRGSAAAWRFPAAGTAPSRTPRAFSTGLPVLASTTCGCRTPPFRRTSRSRRMWTWLRPVARLSPATIASFLRGCWTPTRQFAPSSALPQRTGSRR